MKESFRQCNSVTGRDTPWLLRCLENPYQERSKDGHVDMTNRDLRGVYIKRKGMNDKASTLHKFDFSGSDLSGAVFEQTRFSRSKFLGTNLSKARFSSVRLRECLLKEADFGDSVVSGLIFEGCTPRQSSLMGLRGNDIFIVMSPEILATNFLGFKVKNPFFYAGGKKVTGVGVSSEGFLVPEESAEAVLVEFRPGTQDFSLLYDGWRRSLPHWVSPWLSSRTWKPPHEKDPASDPPPKAQERTVQLYPTLRLSSKSEAPESLVP